MSAESRAVQPRCSYRSTGTVEPMGGKSAVWVSMASLTATVCSVRLSPKKTTSWSLANCMAEFRFIVTYQGLAPRGQNERASSERRLYWRHEPPRPKHPAAKVVGVRPTIASPCDLVSQASVMRALAMSPTRPKVQVPFLLGDAYCSAPVCSSRFELIVTHQGLETRGTYRCRAICI